MPSNFTRSSLKGVINGRIFNKQAQLVSIDTTINNSAREVVSAIDMTSLKRKSTLAPKLFTDIYDYTCPTDLKKLIDIQPQKPDRATTFQWNLTSEEEFDRWKNANTGRWFSNDHPTTGGIDNLVAFSDRDMVRKLKLSTVVEDNTIVIGNLDTLTGDGGTWTLFGDGTNLTSDTDNYIKGSGSINWDITAAGGTTAGIYNSGLSSHDISEHMANGSAFVWTYITSTTNVTNYILRLGSSDSAYHSWTATTNAQGNSFETGWNLIKWDLTSPTDTGTPDDEAIDYAAIYMTKDAAKVSETDYRFDWLVVKKGDYYNVVYYSNYPWQSATGTWKLDSTVDTDYLNVDPTEYSLIIEKCVENCFMELREDPQVPIMRFNMLKEDYLKDSKSEAKKSHTKYYNI